MSIRLLFLFLLCHVTMTNAQEISQNIRGTVVDSETQYPLVGAKVKVISDSTSTLGAVCDPNGKFAIYNVPIGKHILEVTFIGYEPKTIPAIVNSGKETILNIRLEEKAIQGNEVTVTARKRGEVLNDMATVSSLSFSVEETNRFAGSRADPARMMSNYAGAQGTDDSRNDLVIRGNSPLGIVYRVDGVSIPNPNHFAIAGSSGGPVSILNNKQLDNSDFFMSAFPAEYGNSVAGIFDLRLRSGNDQRHEFSGQFGFLGTEAMFEGPLSKKTGASYLVMGRYSTLSLIDKLGVNYGTDATPSYFDGAYKLNFPMSKGGQLSVWGMGGRSSIDIVISDQTVPSQDAFGEQDRDQYFGTDMLVNGLTYKKPINENLFFKTSWAYSIQNQYTRHDYILRHLDTDSNWVYDAPPFQMMGYNYNIQTAAGYFSFNQKINKNHVIKYGMNVDAFFLDFKDSIRFDIADSAAAFYYRWDYQPATPDLLAQAFIQWKYKINNKLTLNAGLHSQYFTLSNSLSPVEPRIGLKYEPDQRQVIAIGGGLHSQIQPLYIYGYHLLDSLGNKIYHNQNMGMTRSIHSVLSYSRVFKKSFSLKTEVYYQYLYNVPVEVEPSSFSILNQGSGFSRFFPDSLENTGTGYNYGLELTLQKYFDNSFYFMTTTSLYQSKYVGSDGIERNTDYNGNYIFNILAGKEFTIGDQDKHLFSIGGKLTYAGGKRYGYVDTAQTNLQKEVIYLDQGYNERQFRDYFRVDAKVYYTFNAEKVTHEFGIDIVNLFDRQNVLGLTYTPNETNPSESFATRYQLGRLPLFYYRIDFKLAGK